MNSKPSRRHFLSAAGAATGTIALLARTGRSGPIIAEEQSGETANRLFWTRFAPNTSLGPYPGPNGFQEIEGTDSSTGYTWPPRINGGTGHLQLIDLDATQPDSIVTMTRHDGTVGPVLHQIITIPPGTGNCQNLYVVEPASDPIDLYVRYWVFFPGDLLMRMSAAPKGIGWRLLYEFKTRDRFGRDDYRFGVMIRRRGNKLYWHVGADYGSYRRSTGDKELWHVDHHGVPVPVGRWFKFECYWHRSRGPDARFWVAVDSQTICDHWCDGRDGAPIGSYGLYGGWIDRVMCFQMYGSDRPQEQWIDDFVIYDAIPGSSRR